jgi:hypothetical protein
MAAAINAAIPPPISRPHRQISSTVASENSSAGRRNRNVSR